MRSKEGTRKVPEQRHAGQMRNSQLTERDQKAYKQQGKDSTEADTEGDYPEHQLTAGTTKILLTSSNDHRCRN